MRLRSAMDALSGLAVAAHAAALGGCDRPAPPGAAGDAPSATAAIAVTPPAATSGAAAPAADHMELLRLTLTRGVKNKDPIDRLDAARAGERIYAHLAVRNRTGEMRRVELTFQVGGQTRTVLHLKVEPSWRYRTWGYNTLTPRDTGELAVIVREEDGPELGDAVVPIRAAAQQGAP